MRHFSINDPWSVSPWSQSPITPNIPGVSVPQGPRPPSAPRQKRAVPRIDDLFDIQKDLIKAINSIKHFEQTKNQRDLDRADTNVRNAYKILNRYLHDYGGGSTNTF